MCEFQIFVAEPGKSESLVTEDISYLEILKDGSILLRGLGIQDKIDNAIIKEINTYAEEGATAKLFKAPIVGDFLKVLKILETGSYSSELEKNWEKLVSKGRELIDQMKNK